MRQLRVVVFLAMSLGLIAPVFGKPMEPSPAPKGPPTFVEEPVPDGKGIIYLFSEPSANYESLLALSKNGPIGVLKHGTYLSFITDPGKTRLWFTFESSVSVDLDVVAGQSYYVRAAGGFLYGGFGNQRGVFTEILTPEKAKKDDQILYCKKVE